MEQNINIAGILRDMPKGTKLYSPLFGEAKFDKITIADMICISSTNDNGKEVYNHFMKNGSFYSSYSQSECLLFPSKEMRDWTKFFKRGDVVYTKVADYVTSYAIFESWKNDNYTEFNASIFHSNASGFTEREVCTTKLYTKATDILKAKIITFIEQHYKGKYNPDTLKVDAVEPEYQFKPFDKVLVKENADDSWHIDFFECMHDSTIYPYRGISGLWGYCIPYEGNELLFGTTDKWEGGEQ